MIYYSKVRRERTSGHSVRGPADCATALRAGGAVRGRRGALLPAEQGEQMRGLRRRTLVHQEERRASRVSQALPR